MRKLFVLLLSGVLLSFNVAAKSAGADAAQVLSELLAAMTSFKADFTQRQYDEDSQLLQSSKGSAAILKPGKMRWQIDTPFSNLILVNGSVLWRYDEDLEQASREKLSDDLSQTPALLLSGDSAQVAKSYDVNVVNENDAAIEFMLLPKVQGSLFKSLALSFENDRLLSMKIVDDFDQTTEILFDEIAVNVTLTENLFEFSVPEGTDVMLND